MKISVITVCFNAAQSIRHTIESFLAQSYRDKELLILDGHSHDDTVAVVKRFLIAHPGAPVHLFSEPDHGMYDALNKGLARFSGDVVGALNADDTYHDKHVLDRIADAMESVDIVHGDLNFVADHGGKRVVRRWRARPNARGGFRSGWMPAHPTFYVRRRVIDAVGGFDLTYRTASDYDFMLRAVELHDFRLAKVPGVMVDMMVGGQSTRSLTAHIHHNVEALRSRRRWLGAPPIDAALIAKPFGKVGQFFGISRSDV